MKPRKKPKTRLDGALDFASVGLAAGAGLLSMGAFAAYLGALHPPTKKRRVRKSRR